MDKPSILLKNIANENNFGITDFQIKQFEKLYELLKEYNSHTNLVGNDEIQTVYERHFIDSLFIGFYLNNKNIDVKNKKLIDIGTGGGFPAIPLAILFPEMKVFGLDSVAKKLKFIDQVAQELELKNLNTILGRSEELARGKYREVFDFATTRAVAHLAIISEYSIPFLKKDGLFLAMKSKTANEEIDKSKIALKELDSKLIEKFDYEIPNNDFTRNILVIKKIKITHSKYPRKIGIPKKEPL